MIHRRNFLKLVAGGLVVSKWPGTLFGDWGQAIDHPSEALNSKKSYFDFDETLDHTVRFALLSVDVGGMQAIRPQNTNMPWFEVLPCAENDAQLADAVVAIRCLRTNSEESINLYFFAHGTSENLPRVLDLAKAARLIDAFTVPLIIETEDTNSTQWSDLCAMADIDNLCIISPADMRQNTAILAPELADQPLALANMTALRAHTELVWDTGPIGIDYADYKSVIGGKLKSFLGVGRAGSKFLGHLAAQKALEGLAEQGVDMTRIQGCWVTIFAGVDCTMEEFDAIVMVIHGALDENTNVIIGMRLEVEFAGDFIVTVLAMLPH